MKLGNLDRHINLKHDGTILYNFGKGIVDVKPEAGYLYNRLHGLYKYFKGFHTDEEKLNVYNQVCKDVGLTQYIIPVDENGIKIPESNEELIKTSIEALINFFSEFTFEPNFRFVNTFAYACNESNKTAREFIENYFELTDNVNADAIKEKIKSQEFTQIISNFSKVIPSHQVNTRFKLYYGSAGCGKTTLAMKEANNNCMVCHSAMLPSDLMEDFKFVDGKADFQPSALQIAMTEGKPIVLDEINLLPFESLRFMQSILDGKSEFVYKGKTIKIKEGFQVIGTMNLTVNGCTYALPEPLVDRCFQAKKFKLTANDLMSAII